jgi:hypothetical protein
VHGGELLSAMFGRPAAKADKARQRRLLSLNRVAIGVDKKSGKVRALNAVVTARARHERSKIDGT